MTGKCSWLWSSSTPKTEINAVVFRSLIALRLQTLRWTCILVITRAKWALLWNSEDGIPFSTIANELAAFLLRKWWCVTLVRFTFSSGLLAALLDLPAADSSQGNEQHEQAHGQANCYPQSHWGECNVLTWREWKRERSQSLIIYSCTAKTGCTTVTAVSITIYFTTWDPWLSTVHDRTRQLASPHSLTSASYWVWRSELLEETEPFLCVCVALASI